MHVSIHFLEKHLQLPSEGQYCYRNNSDEDCQNWVNTVWYSTRIHQERPEFSVSGMVRELGWDSLQDRHRNARLALLFKAVNGEVAIPISKFVTTQDRCTRGASTSNFKHIRANTQPYRHSFTVRTIPEWNGLPAETKSSTTVASFKSWVEGHYQST